MEYNIKLFVLFCIFIILCYITESKHNGNNNGNNKKKREWWREAYILDDNNFEKLTNASHNEDNKLPWFINFYSPTCPKCKSLMTPWDNLASELRGKVRIGKIDCIVNKFTRNRFKITQYPTFFFLHEGKTIRYGGIKDPVYLRSFAKVHWNTTQFNKKIVKIGPPYITTLSKMQTELKKLWMSHKMAGGIVASTASLLGFLFGWISRTLYYKTIERKSKYIKKE